jgi:hypothetical protein
MPDVVRLRECHIARGRVDGDREVGRGADRAGDHVARPVEHDLRALADPVAVTGTGVHRI